MILRRRNGPFAWCPCVLLVAAAIWLTGCPKRIDVAPDGDGGKDRVEPSPSAPAGGGDSPTTTGLRKRRSVPVHFVAQTTVKPRSSRVARDAATAERTAQPDVPDAQDGKAFDPVAANGEIFAGWPQPQVAILFSGEQDGYLEPCGCAGLENQKGGLSRRHTLIKQLREKGWPVVPLDLGGQVKRIGPQAEIKLRHALESLITLGYQAVALGPRDLRVDVLGVAVNLDAATNPFVCANVALVDFDSGFAKRFHVVEAGGKRIGVTSILGKQQLQGLENLDYVQLDPTAALKEIVPQLQAAKCDYLVLLSHATPDESRQLAQAFPEFDFVLTAGGAEEPPAAPAQIQDSHARLVEVGHKGMYVGVLGLYDEGGKRTFRYQRVPLDSRFPDSPEMHQMMVTYQNELETIGLGDLGLAGTRHETGRQFVGTQKCSECHTEAMVFWEESPHAHATETLVKLDPPRHFDPECLSCHATGWNPQKYFPYASGFTGLAKSPRMTANGCENCHGPGSTHVAAETGDDQVDEAEKLRRRDQMRLSLVENEGNKPGQAFGKVVENCMQCHDLDNSPDFDFQKFWPVVEHYGKE